MNLPGELGTMSVISLTILGICAKPALPGLDCALVQYRWNGALTGDLVQLEVLHFEESDVPETMRKPILDCFRQSNSVSGDVSRANALMGQVFSTAAKSFMEKYSIGTESIDAIEVTMRSSIGSLFSLNRDSADARQPDWATILTTEMGVSTITDVSITQYSAVPSQISPIAFLNTLLLRHPTKHIVSLHIDDTASLTLIPSSAPTSSPPPLSTHNCGPGNLLIDYSIRYSTANTLQHDRHGRYAAQGTINQSVVDQFLETHPSGIPTPAPFQQPETEMFGDHEAQHLIDECLFLGMGERDTVATITRVSAESIAREYRRFVDEMVYANHYDKIDEVFVCGPGARNASIVRFLQKSLVGSNSSSSSSSSQVRLLDEVGVLAEANDAVASAHLGLEVILRFAAQASEMGDGSVVVDGRVVKGGRWDEVVGRVAKAGGVGDDGKLHALTRRIVAKGHGDLEGAMRHMVLSG